MRTLAWLVVAAGCSNKAKIDHERVDVLDLVYVRIAVPAGWNLVTRATNPVPRGSKALVLDRDVEGFPPSILVQEVSMSPPDHEAFRTATDTFCHDAILIPLSQTEDTIPDYARPISFGAFRGCEVGTRGKTTSYASRHLGLSNGTVAISIVCNHDQHPQAGVDVDRACEAVARAITPKW